jgi:ankyrin repeat protein
MSGGDWKAMFKGIQENDLELVKFYLKSGIDPNYQHPEFMALPIAESIRYNNIEITKLLLQNGANPLTTEMESGLTPLDTAKKRNDQKTVDLLNSFI